MSDLEDKAKTRKQLCEEEYSLEQYLTEKWVRLEDHNKEVDALIQGDLTATSKRNYEATKNES